MARTHSTVDHVIESGFMASPIAPIPASVLYEDEWYRITNTTLTLTLGQVTYPLRNVAKVLAPFQNSLDLTTMAVNIGFAIGGLIALLQFSIGWMICGLIMIAVGVFNVKSELYARPWMVFVTMTDGTEIKRDLKDENAIRKIYAALQFAMG